MSTGPGETRDRILDAGEQAIVAKSYNSCGLSEILSAAGVPKGSFYHYFKSKEGFGVALVEKSADELAEWVDEFTRDRSKPPLERVRAFFVESRDCYIENGPIRECLLAKMALETAQLSEPMRAAIKCAYDQWASSMAAAIREAQATGDADASVDADVLANQLINAWEGATIRMQIDRNVAPLNEFIDVTLERVLAPH